MGIVVSIVTGLVLMTVFASYFDYLGKKSKGGSTELTRRIDELEKRLDAMDAQIGVKDERIDHLEQELSFVNKLLDKKD